MQYKRTNEVCKIFSISKSTLYRYAKEKPDFPKPIKASPKITLWDIAEIEEYFKKVSIQNKKIMQQQMKNIHKKKILTYK